MYGKRLIWQLYLPFLLVTVLPLVGMGWYATYMTAELFEEEKAYDLERITYLVEGDLIEGVRAGSTDRVDTICKRLGRQSSVRITVILPDGNVIGESQDQPILMVNHLDRPEVQEALGGKVGRSVRFSETIQTEMMYVARTLDSGGRVLAVLRVSLPMTAIEGALAKIRGGLVVGGVFVALIVALAAIGIFRRVIEPLGALREGAIRLTNGEAGVRFPASSTREIHELGVVLNAMADSLTLRVEQERFHRAQTQAILGCMSEGVMAVDSEDHVILINEAARKMLRVGPGEAKGRLLQEVVRNSALDALIHQARDSSDPASREVTVYGPESRRLIGSCSILRGSDGARIGALLVLNDITRMRRLETIAHDFVANVSHELKTPVTTIQGFVETLLDGVYLEPEKAERFLGITLRQVGRLNAIIEDLLTLSTLDSPEGRAEIFLEDALIRDVLLGAVEVSRTRAECDPSRVDLQCEEGLRARINAPLMEQALINLIDNALKYSGSEAPIEVRARSRGDEVVLSVRDRGVGIDPQHQARIFERFYRVDRNRSRKEGGTGLGLSIVDHIVKVHRGRVELVSVLGKGSEFTLFFPKS